MEAWLLTKDRVIEVPVGRIPEEFVWKTPAHTQPQTQPSPAPRLSLSLTPSTNSTHSDREYAF